MNLHVSIAGRWSSGVSIYQGSLTTLDFRFCFATEFLEDFRMEKTSLWDSNIGNFAFVCDYKQFIGIIIAPESSEV